jgi:hypothetical protein
MGEGKFTEGPVQRVLHGGDIRIFSVLMLVAITLLMVRWRVGPKFLSRMMVRIFASRCCALR